MSIEGLMEHSCDIESVVSVVSSPISGEARRTFAIVATGVRCQFDEHISGPAVGVVYSKEQEYLNVHPYIYLPLPLPNGYTPKNGDIVIRRDIQDPQYTDKRFRMIKIENYRGNHYEGTLELVT